MHLLFLTVTTDTKWIERIAKIPLAGEAFLFALMFIPPALLSFLAATIIPGLGNDVVGFAKASLVLLPGWNAFLWFTRIKLYIFVLVPAWIFFGGFAILTVILRIAGVYDGQ